MAKTPASAPIRTKIRKAFAIVRASKRNKQGKLVNKQLAHRMPQLLRWIRQRNWEQVEYQCDQIIAGK